MRNQKQTINFADLMNETIKRGFGSAEKKTYCDYRIWFSTAVDLLVEQQPEFLDEVLQSVRKNKNIEDGKIVECCSFSLSEPYYLQRAEDKIYVFFFFEH